jgi:hypothetical protein
MLGQQTTCVCGGAPIRAHYMLRSSLLQPSAAQCPTSSIMQVIKGQGLKPYTSDNKEPERLLVQLHHHVFVVNVQGPRQPTLVDFS